MFQGLYSLNPHQNSTMNPLWSLQHFKTLTCVSQYLKTQSSFREWTLVKTAWINAWLCLIIKYATSIYIRELIWTPFTLFIWFKNHQECIRVSRGVNFSKRLPRKIRWVLPDSFRIFTDHFQCLIWTMKFSSSKSLKQINGTFYS